MIAGLSQLDEDLKTYPSDGNYCPWVLGDKSTLLACEGLEGRVDVDLCLGAVHIITQHGRRVS